MISQYKFSKVSAWFIFSMKLRNSWSMYALDSSNLRNQIPVPFMYNHKSRGKRCSQSFHLYCSCGGNITMAGILYSLNSSWFVKFLQQHSCFPHCWHTLKKKMNVSNLARLFFLSLWSVPVSSALKSKFPSPTVLIY